MTKIICDKCMREAEVTGVTRPHSRFDTTPRLAFLHIRCHDVEELVKPDLLPQDWDKQTLVWSNIDQYFETFENLAGYEKTSLSTLTDGIDELLLYNRVRRSHAQYGSEPLYGDTEAIDRAIDTLLLFRKDPRP